MANAWGLSWGVAWGSSWGQDGVTPPAPDAVPAGADGGRLPEGYYGNRPRRPRYSKADRHQAVIDYRKRQAAAAAARAEARRPVEEPALPPGKLTDAEAAQFTSMFTARENGAARIAAEQAALAAGIAAEAEAEKARLEAVAAQAEEEDVEALLIAAALH